METKNLGMRMLIEKQMKAEKEGRFLEALEVTNFIIANNKMEEALAVFAEMKKEQQ